ncbi:MAG TPA: prolipoprotein diacylglyceryl transferase family protein [Bacilli bacterium]
MTFPVYFHLGSLTIHPHWLFEALAYFVGFRLYLLTRTKGRIPIKQAMWIIVGATIGAAPGSKLLYWLEDPFMTLTRWNDWQYMMSGKTIVGGLLGGLIGVEWTKKRIGLTRSTGDDLVFPLIVGMAIGRVGCFLTGLSDHTYGTSTSWITGIDFGDGVMRHPTQLYEIVFLLLMMAFLFMLRFRNRRMANARQPDGILFQQFMFSYLLFRFFIDFIKPTLHPYAGLNNIQLACLAGLGYYTYLLFVKKESRKDLTDAEEPTVSLS